jgi:hypothetical protein
MNSTTPLASTITESKRITVLSDMVVSLVKQPIRKTFQKVQKMQLPTKSHTTTSIIKALPIEIEKPTTSISIKNIIDAPTIEVPKIDNGPSQAVVDVEPEVELPSIVNNHTVELWCYCRGKYDGSKMIGCDGFDGNQCRIEWFHNSCLKEKNIKIPKGKKAFFCPDCIEKKNSINIP